ncbi:MAG: hypothetical protein RL021_1173 [Bacteroidota bacterium]|jgi:hypothetical protein
MDYRRFHDLIEAKGTSAASELTLLQEFVRDHPYCQTGHMLLSASMHRQDHVSYESQLKRTAVAVPDRIALYNLINGRAQPSVVSTSVFRTDAEPSPFVTEDPLFPVTAGSSAEEQTDSPFAERLNMAGIPVQEKVPLPSNRPSRNTIHPSMDEDVPETVSAAYALMGDRHDLVRRRLEDLFARPTATPKPSQPDSEPADTSGESAAPQQVEKDVFMLSDPLSQDEEAFFREMELGHAFEDSFLQELEKLPEIVPAVPANTEPVKSAETEATAGIGGFFSWLRRNSRQGFGQFEEVTAEEEAVSQVRSDEHPAQPETTEESADKRSEAIIDDFIRNAPRIVPQPKAEFFSPIVQARRSVEEHDDLVSGTLAAIYADQGNLQKARWCYQQLSLLHPEKKAYFAALIKKLDQRPDSGSEDL